MSLRGRSAVANGASIDAHLEFTRASTDVAWQRAATREHALAALFEGSGPWGQRASDIAKSIGITRALSRCRCHLLAGGVDPWRATRRAAPFISVTKPAKKSNQVAAM
jgi:hypothetical protein